jgi:hypothetical protein
MDRGAQGEVRFGEHLTPARHLLRSAATSGPGILWVTLFLLVPLVAIGAISFATRGPYGELQGPLTFANYTRLAGFGLLGFDPLYPLIILRSLVLGAGATAVCLLAGFPLAYFISILPERWKATALTLVVIPFWTNLLIRTYAWQLLLAPDGILARLAAALGLAPAGVALYPSAFAVYLGMLCATCRSSSCRSTPPSRSSTGRSPRRRWTSAPTGRGSSATPSSPRSCRGWWRGSSWSSSPPPASSSSPTSWAAPRR